MFEGRTYINGEWYDPKSLSSTQVEHFEKIDPSTEKVLGRFPKSPPKVVHYAAQSAHKAFESWKKTSRIFRADLFDNLAQIIKREQSKIAEVISKETGKSINESNAEVVEAIHMVQYVFSRARMPVGEILESEIPGKKVKVIRKPRGVTAVITPWNFPFAIPFWTAGPALLEGNTVVFKPSEDSPQTGHIITEMMIEAGFPAGVFNLVYGEAEAGIALVEDEYVKTILFTGSADVGDYIQGVCAKSKGKICSCEMGSKSAVIIHKDANIDLAVDAAVASFSKLSGQRCVSASRLIVHGDIVDQFTEKFLSRSEKLVVGNPFEKEIDFGPLINKQALEKVKRYNKLVQEDKQAKILFSQNMSREGHFIGPFIYRTLWRDVPYLKEEVFGPHVAIIPYHSRSSDKYGDVREACRIYNDTDFALAVGIITNDPVAQSIFEEECEAGMIYFNGGSIAAESHLPFGGSKRSGNNRPSAAGTFDTVVNKVAVTTNLNSDLQFPQGMK